jgi:radical SAM protein with 4Fe4S-binding SPASM domain
MADPAPETPLFDAVQIQTHTRCNFTCKFCPHGKIELQHGEMTEETFRRVVQALKELDFAGDIYPYLMNEPLMDKGLVERVAALRAACPKARIWIDTNGSLASTELLEKLVRAGASVITLEIYLARGKRMPEKYVRMREALSEESRAHVFLYERDAEAVLTNRAGNVPDRPVPKTPWRLPCERPFRQIYIAYDGSLLLCCQDYRREAIMGNLLTTPLKDLWRNEAYARVRAEMLRPGRATTLCERCDYSGRPGDMPKALRARLGVVTRLRWQAAWLKAAAQDVIGNRMLLRYARSWYARRVKGGAARHEER